MPSDTTTAAAPTEVWVLTQESGEYDNDVMGVLGVFATPDAAKKFVDKDCAEAVARHPSNHVYGNRTPWREEESYRDTSTTSNKGVGAIGNRPTGFTLFRRSLRYSSSM